MKKNVTRPVICSRCDWSFNLFHTNAIFHKNSWKKVRMVQCINCGVTGYNFQKKIVFLSLKINFVLANSADPDEMPHHVAFHLGLHCLQKFSFRGFQVNPCHGEYFYVLHSPPPPPPNSYPVHLQHSSWIYIIVFVFLFQTRGPAGPVLLT